MNNTNDKKDKNQLRVGAARICITPEPEYFPMEHFRNHMTGKPSIFSGKIAEDIFFRLILVENAHTRSCMGSSGSSGRAGGGGGYSADR